MEYPYWYNAATRLQHYDSTGTPLWNQNGILLTRQDSTAYSSSCYAVTDSAGGVIVVWHDYRQSTGQEDWDVYAQRYNADGIALWDSGGVLVTTRHQTPTQIFPDQQGGVIIRAGEWFYKFDSGGESVWDASGIHALFFPEEIISDGDGGVIGLGGIRYSTSLFPHFDQALVMNRLNSAGEWVWSDSAVTVTDTLKIEYPGRVVFHVTLLEYKSALIAWVKGGPTMDGIWLQRLGTTGQMYYEENGRHFIEDSSAVLWSITPSTSLSAILFCSFLESEEGLFAQKIDSTGNPAWSDSGVLVTTRDRSVIDLVSDGHGGAILATGNGSLKQISANGNLGEIITRIDDPPTGTTPLPNEFTLLPPYPNPFNHRVTLQYRLQRPGDVTLTVYDLLGDKVWETNKKNQSAGMHETTWDGTTRDGRPVSSGLYLVTGQTKRHKAARKVMFLK